MDTANPLMVGRVIILLVINCLILNKNCKPKGTDYKSVPARNYKINFWRTAGGAEVDCVVDMGNTVIPIEIKSSRVISQSDISGLKMFLNDYQKIAKQGLVVTTGEKKEKITENITAVPWFYM